MLFTYFDIETSGLESDADVLSFAYMLATENLEVKRAETLYFWKEGVTKWSEEAYEVNGLSKEFLRQYETQYEDNLKKMYIVLSYADLVGYNSGYVGKDGMVHGFDFPRCQSFLIRNGLYEPKVSGFYDVMRMLGKRVKLDVAFEKYGLSPSLADTFNRVYFKTDSVSHVASYDVVRTAMLFQQLYNEQESSTSATFYEEMEQRSEDEYKLFFNSLGELMVRNLYDNTEYSINDFKEKDTSMFEKMMANPASYM